VEPAPEAVPPPGGWRKPTCTFESHRWELEVEGGRADLTCTDPCDSRPDEHVRSAPLFDPAEPPPVCLFPWEPEDIVMDIPVTVTYVDDSTPSTPAGPAEYGYYLEVRPA
jgi:hypothetical protein